MPGKPGDPEFIAAYKAAAATKAKPRQGALLSVMNEFQASSDLDDLAPRKQADYVKLIKVIGKKFGDFPLSGMSDRRTHGIFMEWRDERAKASRRQADYGWQVLARILSWGHGRGLVQPILARRAGASIAAPGWLTSGLPPTRPHSMPALPRTCICRSHWPCGPAGARATCCGSLDSSMTAR
ncbi:MULTISPECIES: hypothetical protein [unclassified Mesorhizobium]|uniref:hypothetical protein n=1 Tax=unclassified Mesorhizobium TaxID=325217 RepID=UPI0003FA0515|nr:MULTISPECIES: hypothetical protein [unclassified Mesorhizobium]